MLYYVLYLFFFHVTALNGFYHKTLLYRILVGHMFDNLFVCTTCLEIAVLLVFVEIGRLLRTCGNIGRQAIVQLFTKFRSMLLNFVYFLVCSLSANNSFFFLLREGCKCSLFCPQKIIVFFAKELFVNI